MEFCCSVTLCSSVVIVAQLGVVHTTNGEQLLVARTTMWCWLRTTHRWTMWPYCETPLCGHLAVRIWKYQRQKPQGCNQFLFLSVSSVWQMPSVHSTLAADWCSTVCSWRWLQSKILPALWHMQGAAAVIGPTINNGQTMATVFSTQLLDTLGGAEQIDISRGFSERVF